MTLSNHSITELLIHCFCGTLVISDGQLLNGFNREFDRLCLVSRADNPVEIKTELLQLLNPHLYIMTQ